MKNRAPIGNSSLVFNCVARVNQPLNCTYLRRRSKLPILTIFLFPGHASAFAPRRGWLLARHLWVCSPRQWRRMTCAGSEWWWCTSAAMSLTLMALALTTLPSMGAGRSGVRSVGRGDTAAWVGKRERSASRRRVVWRWVSAWRAQQL